MEFDKVLGFKHASITNNEIDNDVFDSINSEKTSIANTVHHNNENNKRTKMSSDDGKQSWPELVGTNGDDAVSVIKRENLKVVQAHAILYGSMVTADYRLDRVRVWVDENSKVVRVPKLG